MSPLDKKIPNKNYILNYWPVSTLHTFSKIFDKVIKNYLKKSMDNYFLPISQHIERLTVRCMCMRLIEE